MKTIRSSSERLVIHRVVLSVLIVLSPSLAAGQRDAVVSTGPTLQETREWLQRALPELGTAVSADTLSNGLVILTNFKTYSADIVDCQLVVSGGFEIASQPERKWTHRIPLAMVDLTRLAVAQGSMTGGRGADVYVRVQARIGTRPFEYNATDRPVLQRLNRSTARLIEGRRSEGDERSSSSDGALRRTSRSLLVAGLDERSYPFHRSARSMSQLGSCPTSNTSLLTAG